MSELQAAKEPTWINEAVIVCRKEEYMLSPGESEGAPTSVLEDQRMAWLGHYLIYLIVL